MKTSEDNLQNHTQSVKNFLKEVYGKDLPNVENANFTREDYLQNYKDVNHRKKHISRDTTKDKSRFEFIVVWQNYQRN